MAWKYLQVAMERLSHLHDNLLLAPLLVPAFTQRRPKKVRTISCILKLYILIIYYITLHCIFRPM